MDVILKEDMSNLGYKNDVVNVKPGYARNYLIPRGKAVIASPANRKMLNENLKQAAHKIQQLKDNARAKAEEIENLDLMIKAKAGTSGKIFGSITTQQLAHLLKDKGFEVDRRKINIEGDAKTLGEHKASVELYKDVYADVSFTVEAEGK